MSGPSSRLFLDIIIFKNFVYRVALCEMTWDFSLKNSVNIAFVDAKGPFFIILICVQDSHSTTISLSLFLSI